MGFLKVNGNSTRTKDVLGFLKISPKQSPESFSFLLGDLESSLQGITCAEDVFELSFFFHPVLHQNSIQFLPSSLDPPHGFSPAWRAFSDAFSTKKDVPPCAAVGPVGCWLSVSAVGARTETDRQANGEAALCLCSVPPAPLCVPSPL